MEKPASLLSYSRDVLRRGRMIENGEKIQTRPRVIAFKPLYLVSLSYHQRPLMSVYQEARI